MRPPLTAGAVLVWVAGAEGGLAAPTRAEAAAAWVLGADGAVAAAVGAALV